MVLSRSDVQICTHTKALGSTSTHLYLGPPHTVAMHSICLHGTDHVVFCGVLRLVHGVSPLPRKHRVGWKCFRAVVLDPLQQFVAKSAPYYLESYYLPVPVHVPSRTGIVTTRVLRY